MKQLYVFILFFVLIFGFLALSTRIQETGFYSPSSIYVLKFVNNENKPISNVRLSWQLKGFDDSKAEMLFSKFEQYPLISDSSGYIICNQFIDIDIEGKELNLIGPFGIKGFGYQKIFFVIENDKGKIYKKMNFEWTNYKKVSGNKTFQKLSNHFPELKNKKSAYYKEIQLKNFK